MASQILFVLKYLEALFIFSLDSDIYCNRNNFVMYYTNWWEIWTFKSTIGGFIINDFDQIKVMRD